MKTSSNTRKAALLIVEQLMELDFIYTIRIESDAEITAYGHATKEAVLFLGKTLNHSAIKDPLSISEEGFFSAKVQAQTAPGEAVVRIVLTQQQ
jgi:hypothetical protein